jgi:hypothetical protein
VLAEYRYDPVGFADKHCGVALHIGQQEFLREAFRFDENGKLRYKYPNLTASNRWGKTVVVAISHLWFSVYKHGLNVLGSDWFEHPYGIMNICPLVDLANLARDMVNDLLQNKAKEQILRPGGRGYCDLGPMFERGDDGYLVTFGDYKGFRTKVTSVTMEYRTSSDNAKALQGKPLYYVSVDEAGRQKDFQNLMGAHVVPRTLDTGGVIATYSTPDVDTGTDYEAWCMKGDPENYYRDRLYFYYRGSIYQNSHIKSKDIDDLKAGVPEFLWPQVLEGRFVQGSEAFFGKPSLDRAFKMDIRPNLGREGGRLYIVGADFAVAKAGDRSVFAVIDATQKPFRLLRLMEYRGVEHPDLIAKLLELNAFYNAEWKDENGSQQKCEGILTYDSTGLGGKMFQTEMSTFIPRPRGYDFGGVTKKKLQILSSLRLILDKNWLVIPATYGGLKQELRDYKRTDAKLDTDSVMALALAVHLAEKLLPVELDEEAWEQGVY